MPKWVFLFLFGCVVTPVQGTTHYSPLINKHGNPFHWKSIDFPIQVFIDPSIPTIHQEAAYRAEEFWDRIVGSDVFHVQHAPRDFPMFLGILRQKTVTFQSIELGKNQYGDIRGLAEIYLYTGARGQEGEIVCAQVWLDDDIDDLQRAVRVSIHEFGHVLGLRHDPNDQDSIMWFETRPGQILQEEDLEYVRSTVFGQ